jgi:hypothetical protein
MSRGGHTQPCSDADARVRLKHAQRFTEVALIVADEGSDIEYSSVAASLCVLAGIAASDAACCRALGLRARGRDHREAVSLVERIDPGGDEAANALKRLLGLKDEAHYGLIDVSGTDLRAALRQAGSLVAFAETLLE